jgi:chromosome segregation ATPase
MFHLVIALFSEAQEKRAVTAEGNLEQLQQRCGSLQQELELKAASLGKVAVELQKANESIYQLQSELSLSQNKKTELEEVCCTLQDRQLFCTNFKGTLLTDWFKVHCKIFSSS